MIAHPLTLTDMPPEVILHIYSYLDIPDLETVAQTCTILASLATDPALHRNRLRVVAPSRVRHSLFGLGPQGLALRPTLSDLVHRNVMRGLMIESRRRRGEYIYTQGSIKQYELRSRLARLTAERALSGVLRLRGRQPMVLIHPLHQTNALPDTELSSLTVSRSLLPTVRQLKWSFKRDKLSQMLRSGAGGSLVSGPSWLERTRSIVKEHERVRLALCPDVRKIVRFYDDLAIH